MFLFTNAYSLNIGMDKHMYEMTLIIKTCLTKYTYGESKQNTIRKQESLSSVYKYYMIRILILGSRVVSLMVVGLKKFSLGSYSLEGTMIRHCDEF